MTTDTIVITVSGPSGSGKSSLVRALAEAIGDSSCLYSDEYGEGMHQPPDGAAWIREGADLSEFRLPAFGADVTRLKQGEPIVTPAERTVMPAKVLIIEDPFGRGCEDMKDLVDLSVCIDVPMEIALARRLLESFEKWGGTPEERVSWATNYLKSYLMRGKLAFGVALFTYRGRSNSTSADIGWYGLTTYADGLCVTLNFPFALRTKSLRLRTIGGFMGLMRPAAENPSM